MDYTDREMEVLNEVAQELFGWQFEELDYEEQDTVYCRAEDTGRLYN